MRLGLGIGLSYPRHSPPANPLCDAVQRKVCVTATHKRKSLKLAPHAVYLRSGVRSLDALLLSTNGKAANKPKLTTYTIADLSEIVVTDEQFEPLPGFNANDPEYLDHPECVIQAV